MPKSPIAVAQFFHGIILAAENRAIQLNELNEKAETVEKVLLANCGQFRIFKNQRLKAYRKTLNSQI